MKSKGGKLIIRLLNNDNSGASSQDNIMEFSKGKDVALPLDRSPVLSSGEQNQINNHQLEWLVCNSEKQILQPFQSATDEQAQNLRQYADNHKIIVIIPNADVLLLSENLPAMKRQQLIEALPYTFEEQLIEEVDRYFFAAPAHKSKGLLTAAIVTHVQMQQYRDRLTKLGIFPDIMIPEVYSLPLLDKTWYVYLENSQALVRINKYQGCVVDESNLALVFERFLQEDELDQPVTIVIENASENPQALEEVLLKIKSLNLAIEIKHIEEKIPLIQHAINTSDLIPINLLQAKYLTKEKLDYQEWVWPIATCLGIAWVVSYLMIQIFSLLYFEYREFSMQHQTNNIYQQYFPNGKNKENPQADLQQKIIDLQQAANGGEFLQLLAKVGSVIHSYPGVVVKNLDYKNGQLQIDLQNTTPANTLSLISALQNLRLKIQQQQNSSMLHLMIEEAS